MATTSIMGHANGPDCARCGRKIKQSQRVRTEGGEKVHAYSADCKVARSTLVQRTIAQAESLGLRVTVTEESDRVLQSVTVTVSRQPVEAKNMLDVANNAEQINLHSVRTFNTGKWTHHARRSGASGTVYKLRIRNLPYHIEGLTR